MYYLYFLSAFAAVPFPFHKTCWFMVKRYFSSQFNCYVIRINKQISTAIVKKRIIVSTFQGNVLMLTYIDNAAYEFGIVCDAWTGRMDAYRLLMHECA